MGMNYWSDEELKEIWSVLQQDCMMERFFISPSVIRDERTYSRYSEYEYLCCKHVESNQNRKVLVKKRIASFLKCIFENSQRECTRIIHDDAEQRFICLHDGNYFIDEIWNRMVLKKIN
jgi:hypothetical protein